MWQFLPARNFANMNVITITASLKGLNTMRTENQVKRKLNELTVQKRSLEERKTDGANDHFISQINQLEDMIMMLEWVLNEPNGAYHA
jgi:hypothetical protein